MARFRLARPAQADLAYILSISVQQWGVDARRRYAAVLVAAMRQIASAPDGPLTRNRRDLRRGVRSFHVRHAARFGVGARVRRPAHVLYYRLAADGVVEIIRVLHERMDPGRHLDEQSTGSI
jgi:toxin ParE1/3/4